MGISQPYLSKEVKTVNIIISFAILLPMFLSLFSQERAEEKVEVIAMPIYVRVFHKGEAVKDLKKEDFEIYENGIKKEIKGFEIISRKISSSQEGSKEDRGKRLFILIFDIFDYREEVEEGIDYFFQKIYKKGDTVLMVVENRLLYIEREKEVSEISHNLKDTLKKYKKISSHSFSKAFMDLSFEADRLLLELQTGIRDTRNTKEKEINTFLENYKRIWDAYRKQYLIPDLEFYRSILNRIKTMKGEKWAIIFQERKLFPKLKNYGRVELEIRNFIDNAMADPSLQLIARTLQTKLYELQRSFDITYFPWESLQSIFMQENITLHLLLLKYPKDIIDQDFELAEVSQDYEGCLKDASFSTGGSTIFSNKISESLKEVEEKEDCFYLLWFTPSKDLKGERRINVKVKKEGLKVFYSKQISERGKPQITISDFKARNKLIEFTVVNFERTQIEGRLKGTVEVKVVLFDENSNVVFSEGKVIEALKEKLHISLKLDALKNGKYFAIIEVLDKISGSVDVVSKEIEF